MMRTEFGANPEALLGEERLHATLLELAHLDGAQCRDDVKP